jgi:hypothetical protein
MKGLVRRSEAREAAEAAAAAGKTGTEASVGDAEKAKKEADQFALNHYLGNQKRTVANA